MEFDAVSYLSAVDRSVLLFERDGQPVSAVTLSRSFPTTAEDLWDATTTAERISRWFTPVSGDLELGGRYQLEGNADGLITACQRLTGFSLTWEFAGDVSWVEVGYSGDESGGVRIALTHTALISEHWTEYGPGAVGVGWEMGFLGLAIHLSQPDAPMPDEAEFAASPDGRPFIAGSRSAWAEAAIAAGTEPGVARAAERRTTAFYTGDSTQTESFGLNDSVWMLRLEAGSQEGSVTARLFAVRPPWRADGLAGKWPGGQMGRGQGIIPPRSGQLRGSRRRRSLRSGPVEILPFRSRPGSSRCLCSR